jgi:ectoine hydroxylase-related dioxygenase (phytanoyl-CoA dioxygenase family)
MAREEKRPGGLSPQQRRAYREKGLVIVRALFSADEIAAWDGECTRLWSLPQVAGGGDQRLTVRPTVEGAPLADRIDPVIDISPLFAGLARDERLLAIARDLLGDKAVLFKDKLICKWPGMTGYGMHQDFAYWDVGVVPADEVLTVLVSIDAADRDNGAIECFPGLHHHRLPAPEDEPRDVDESKMDVSRGGLAVTAPGDLLVFHSLTPHRSGPNTSGRSRRAVFFSYTTAAHPEGYRLYYERRFASLRAERA